uniref:hypothetical protein n=1 Tax=Pantoea sp. IMH TaxID=1267600 RepID=UPI0004686792|nr:hypothetical protein [Pantoea sp. IMH]
MRTGRSDFDAVTGQAHFYRRVSERFALAGGKVADSDMLWEAVMAVPMPLEIAFVHLGSGQKRRYGALMLLFDEVEEVPEGQFRLNIR